MSTAKSIGEKIGRAMARDVLAEDMPREWTGLDAQDGDVATGAGLRPGTDEWEEMEQAARRAYKVALAESSKP